MSISQMQSSLIPQDEKPKRQPSFLKRLQIRLFEPRSQSRDEAFRERTIRVTLAIIIGITLLSFLTSFAFFQDGWPLLSYKTLYMVMLVFGVLSAYAVSRERIFTAGILLVAVLMATSIGAVIINGSAGSPANLMAFTLTIVMAALVLPRSTVVPLSIASAIIVAILAQFIEGTEVEKSSLIWVSAFGFILESALLLVLRGEFDARLEGLRHQVKETEAARLEADQANTAKSQFLANMSHELRTPLNAIIGYTEIMLGGMAGTFTDKQTQLQTYIQENGHRLLALINDILDLAKVESGRLELVFVPSAPRKVVGTIVEGMQGLTAKKNITLKMEVADDVPEVIMCDVKKTEQVITNLISNGVKFTSEGGVTVRLGTTNPNNWTIKVTDTGMGMPADAANYIFEKFRQVDNTLKREHQGTGLGLAIVKGLVDAMGGTIDLQTELGKGTTFTVTLPRTASEKVSTKAI